MSLLPDRVAAQSLLEQHVQDPYQRLHARMVATAMAGYALRLGEDPHLWFLTGLLHDLDFDRFPDTHPAESLRWFVEWGYPADLIHAVEAHAYLPRLRHPPADAARGGAAGLRRDLWRLLRLPEDEPGALR